MLRRFLFQLSSQVVCIVRVLFVEKDIRAQWKPQFELVEKKMNDIYEER